MDEILIITIDGFCFHLPSLYHWIVNRGNDKNPLTNLPFTNYELQYIEREGIDRFPLEIKLLTMEGEKSFSTSALTSVNALILKLLPKSIGVQTNTLFQFFTAISNSGLTVSSKWGGPNTIDIVDMIVNHENDQINNISESKSITFMVIPLRGSSSTVYLMDRIIALANQKGWSEQHFIDLRNSAQAAIDRHAESRRMVDFYKGMRTGEVEERQPEGTDSIFININTAEGGAYGKIKIFPRKGALFKELEPLIREKVADILPLPDSKMRYIYAGRLYNENSTISSVPNFGEGTLIHVTF